MGVGDRVGVRVGVGVGVRVIEHEEANFGECDLAALDQVAQPAGGRHLVRVRARARVRVRVRVRVRGRGLG